tara:strand:- start:318 stop:1274 length:957 start_codon:yes stop_codon:yes gene_type:complete
MKKKALVTGGAGFVGSHLVDSLIQKDFFVYSLDNYVSGKSDNLTDANSSGNLEEIKGDVCDEVILKEIFDEGIDIVFHQAVSKMTVCLEDPLKDLEVNAGGTLNLLQLSRKHDVEKFIHASTGSVYGEAKYFPTDEDHQTIPSSYYGVSKLAAERYVNVFNKLWGLNTTILRYYHVYGPRQENSDVGGVASIFARRVLENKPIIIFGDGSQIRSFTFVKDVVDINTFAIDNKKMIGNVYNCASGISVSILDLAKQVSSLLGKPNHPIEFEDWKPGDIKHFDVSNENLKDLGFKWNTSFEDGLNQTLAWSKNWINNLKN